MREVFSVSAAIEALQSLIPCTLCDELVVKGDDCPSWRGSLVVKFNIWLNKTNKKSTYSEIADSHMKHQETKEKNIKTTIKRRRTEQLLILFFLPVENPPFVHLFFTTQSLLHKSRPYKKYIVREYSCWTRTDGDYHLFTVLHHDGERANRPREGASPHSASRSADKNIVFTTTRYILFAHRQSDVGCLHFVLAPLP